LEPTGYPRSRIVDAVDVAVDGCVARNLAASNPVRRVKLFHEDNSRLRYLSREEYDRLLKAARTRDTSPYLEETIILAIHTGLRRGSLFNLRWAQIDIASRVVRIPRRKAPPVTQDDDALRAPVAGLLVR